MCNHSTVFLLEGQAPAAQRFLGPEAPASQKPIVDLRYFEKIPNKPQEVEIIGRLKVLRDLNLPAPCLSSNWLV